MTTDKPCPNCGAPVDDLTAIVHREVHKAPFGRGYTGLGMVPFVTMPAIGRLLEIFGTDLLQWLQQETEKYEHCCITGDCPHASQVDCWSKLVHDFAADLREKYEQEQKKSAACTPGRG